MASCKHEPDWKTLQIADEGERKDGAVIDVWCKKCGWCGSTQILSEDLDWGEDLSGEDGS